jgi:glycerol uptake facilitator-like aquaporin
MNKLFIEFIGTLFLVYIILTTGNYLAIGSSLAIIILLGNKISGAHFNPAVTLALASMGKLKKNDVIHYILSQLAGGLAAVKLYTLTKN